MISVLQKIHTLSHASGTFKCIKSDYVSANVALGAVDRSLATCGGKIALKAINTAHSLLARMSRGYGRQKLIFNMSVSIPEIIFCIFFLTNLDIEPFLAKLIIRAVNCPETER